MGISTIASYRCSMLFEAVGLSDAMVDMCFKGVASRIKGACFSDFDIDQQSSAPALANWANQAHRTAAAKG